MEVFEKVSCQRFQKTVASYFRKQGSGYIAVTQVIFKSCFHTMLKIFVDIIIQKYDR